ncbi:hypothetical protein [Variovorax rhizosphaerae]|uniref:Galactosyl transferase GMA12/MNN10 family protein n=1 Tax=Variovorax rhizosphaerae TaxID=1836200 RepID=A0ABU8WK22_9BURK
MKLDVAVATFNVVPAQNLTAKYDRLGEMGLVNRRMWCRRHGYPLVDSAPLPGGRPACWGKLALLAQTLGRHEWVLWADSDALVLELDLGIERFCDGDFDLVTQSMDGVHAAAGVPIEMGRARWPVNTGVFLLRSSDWTLDLLRRADAKTHLVQAPARGPWDIWDGIGDQEALIEALQERPDDLRRVSVVDGLQAHPRLYRPGRDLFVHFWGNHAAHRIPPAEAERTLDMWELAVQRGGPFPADLPTFHWACIQNRAADVPFNRGGPERFLYGVASDGRPCGWPAQDPPPKCGVPPICSE